MLPLFCYMKSDRSTWLLSFKMAARDSSQQRHKPGPLKQQNKSHKHGRHRTKGQADSENKGKVSVKLQSHKLKRMDKNERRNQAKQLRINRRDALVEKRRKAGSEANIPHLLVLIPLTENCDVEALVKHLCESDDNAQIKRSDQSVTIVSSKTKERFTCICPQTSNLFSLLDVAKVADTIGFVMNCREPISSAAETFLPCLLGQGLPSSLQIIQGLHSLPAKRRSEAKKDAMKIIGKWIPEIKVQSVDSPQEGGLALRACGNQKPRVVFYRENRPYLLAEKLEFEDDPSNIGRGCLKVSGYVRGKALSVNGLIHLVGWGDFQMNQIDSPQDPNPMRSRSASIHHRGDSEMTDEANPTKVIAVANPALQVSLQSEADVDPMEGEQTWPEEHELREAEERNKLMAKSKEKSFKVPKGTSEYQASWIIDTASDGEDEAGSSDSDSDADAVAMMDQSDVESEGHEACDNEEFDTVSVSTVYPQDNYDQQMDLDQEQQQLEKYRGERDNEMFPDEVDTPLDMPARSRFQKYRGLKSFRSSPWDPKENLPMDYARIFQFQNFTRMKRRVLKEQDDHCDGALPGWYVTLHVANVPREVIDHTSAGHRLVLFGLLPHEQRMTVMHFVVMRDAAFVEPVQSKDRLVICAGYRRFAANPIFSQHTNGDKFKFERYLPHDKMAVVATTYAPVLFPPAPVLMLDGSQRLVAKGTLYKSDPDRVVAKKMVLSGHPYKINKRTVVVRYMFFNKDDILWFKPVELHTKFGRRGNIREALGTHGHMKCHFDGKFDAKDTVCMALYKRIYPKWTYESRVPDNWNGPTTSQHEAVESDNDMK